MTENQLLWQRIAAFAIDVDGAALPFSWRLARENGWTHAQALAAIEEYRRFVFLAMVADHPVTPSDEVDQVWHLHLCYTRSYWDGLCGEVLGRPLHHGPTRGGADEGAKYDHWYRNTLASYEQHFGASPPRQWWPDSEQRFARRDWRRIDVGDAWLLSRRSLKRQVITAVAVVGLCLAAGCTSMVGKNVSGLIAIMAAFGFVVLVWHLKNSGGGGDGGADAGGVGRTTGERDGGGCGGGAAGHGTYHHDVDDGGGDSGCGGGGCGGGCGE